METAHWLMSDVTGLLRKEGKAIQESPLSPRRFAAILALYHNHTIHSKIAKQLLQAVIETDKDPDQLMAEHNWSQITDVAQLRILVQKTIQENAAETGRLREGDMAPLEFLTGLIMKKTRGLADPRMVKSILKEELHISLIYVLAMGGTITGTAADGEIKPGDETILKTMVRPGPGARAPQFRERHDRPPDERRDSARRLGVADSLDRSAHLVGYGERHRHHARNRHARIHGAAHLLAFRGHARADRVYRLEYSPRPARAQCAAGRGSRELQPRDRAREGKDQRHLRRIRRARALAGQPEIPQARALRLHELEHERSVVHGLGLFLGLHRYRQIRHDPDALRGGRQTPPVPGISRTPRGPAPRPDRRRRALLHP